MSGSVSLDRLLAIQFERKEGNKDTGLSGRRSGSWLLFCHPIRVSPECLHWPVCDMGMMAAFLPVTQPRTEALHNQGWWRVSPGMQDHALRLSTGARADTAQEAGLCLLHAAPASATQFTGSTSASTVLLYCLSWWKMTSYYFLPLGLWGLKEPAATWNSCSYCNSLFVDGLKCEVFGIDCEPVSREGHAVGKAMTVVAMAPPGATYSMLSVSLKLAESG